ncbi:MAG: orotidine-5'-phosphate decarboxylase [bacterium]
MTNEELFREIFNRHTFLCVGLDSDLTKIPKHLLGKADPQFEFNKAIVDATAQYAMAYKPNLAFYECYGKKGWESLEKTIYYIKEKYPYMFTIADAKRGDIGNTSKMYAEAFLKNLPFDAVTVAPYMGEDSVAPFLQFPGKWAIILALTSNKGSFDFQMLPILGDSLDHPPYLHEKVLQKSKEWGTTDNIMYVVGATQASHLKKIREYVPDHFLLVPAVGAQGGSLQEVAKYGLTKKCGLIVNNSRAIIFASDGEDFAEAAAIEAEKMMNEMRDILFKYEIVKY